MSERLLTDVDFTFPLLLIVGVVCFTGLIALNILHSDSKPIADRPGCYVIQDKNATVVACVQGKS